MKQAASNQFPIIGKNAKQYALLFRARKVSNFYETSVEDFLVNGADKLVLFTFTNHTHTKKRDKNSRFLCYWPVFSHLE